jgi:hypothetical protein
MQHFAGLIVNHDLGSGVVAMLASGIMGAALLVVGSNLIIPVGVEIGSLFDLAGIASIMMFLGLAEGE